MTISRRNKPLPSHLRMIAFFNSRWNEITKVIDYNDSWEKTIPPHAEAKKYPSMRQYSYTSLGQAIKYSDVKALLPREEAKTMDDHGRKVIFIGTMLGTVVVFWDTCTNDQRLIVQYGKRITQCRLIESTLVDSGIALHMLIGGKRKTYDDKSFFEKPNIGEHIEFVYKCLSEAKISPESKT